MDATDFLTIKGGRGRVIEHGKKLFDGVGNETRPGIKEPEKIDEYYDSKRVEVKVDVPDRRT